VTEEEEERRGRLYIRTFNGNARYKISTPGMVMFSAKFEVSP
jgi:hypothetical protein